MSETATEATATEAVESSDGLGDAGKKAIDRMKAERDEARKEIRALAEKAKAFDELEAAKKTAEEKLADRATQAEERATKAETNLLRLTVALDAAPDGMPLARVRSLAGRLQGSTEEEMKADAESLFADFTVADTTTPGPRPDRTQGTRTTQDMPLNGDPLLMDLKSKLGIR